MRTRVIINSRGKSLVLHVDGLDYRLGRMKAVDDFWAIGANIEAPKTSDSCIGYAHKLMQLNSYSFSKALAIAEKVILNE